MIYKIIEIDLDLFDFSIELNEFLSAGWELYGDPQIVIDINGNTRGFQAIIKRNNEKLS